MKPDWRLPASKQGREVAVLVAVGIFLFGFALIGNSMTRPLDHLLDAGDRNVASIQVVTHHVSR